MSKSGLKGSGKGVYEFFLKEKITFGTLFAAVGMLLVFSFIKDPEVYTISLIGVEHPALFFILCSVMGLACGSNIIYFFRKSGFKSRVCYVLTYLANIAMVIASFTMTEGYVHIVTELHWAMALMFMIINPVMILLCAVHLIKQGCKNYLIPIVVFAPVYLADVLYIGKTFLSEGPMDGKNGIIEIIPITMTFILLVIFNHTSFLNKKK